MTSHNQSISQSINQVSKLFQECAHLAILDPVYTKLAVLQVAMDDVVTLRLSIELPG